MGCVDRHYYFIKLLFIALFFTIYIDQHIVYYTLHYKTIHLLIFYISLSISLLNGYIFIKPKYTSFHILII